MNLLHLLTLFVSWTLSEAALPTLYEYYTSDGISSGLSVDQPYFTLNSKNISIYSGAMHYFRIPRQYWRDRLRKLRAAGLNTLETYIPWNLHEPQDGVFDFGSGGSDFEEFLDIVEYIKIAQEEDLFVIVRPGPYICSEWEWGGSPSWLLREDGIQVRQNNAIYMKYVARYYNTLIPLLVDLQFTKGGPIIAFQIENEYGYNRVQDKDYLQALVDLYRDNGIIELLVSSDGASSGTSGSLPGVIFQTVNFGDDPEGAFDALQEFQPGQPVMVMEYWTGWYDTWTSATHNTVDDEKFRDLYARILKYPASASMYMFHGGTNFGFTNGANYHSEFQPITTSYDYDAPLAENGDYTGKYEIVRELLKQYNPVELFTPDPPELIPRVAYATINIDGQLSYEDIIERAPFTQMSVEPLAMELLSVNNNSGQSFGYIVYRKGIISMLGDSILEIQGVPHDSVLVMVNGKRINKPLTSIEDLDGFGYWKASDSNITLHSENFISGSLDLIVENWGRLNDGDLVDEKKGLKSGNTVFINDVVHSNWLNIPLEFKRSWNEKLSGWTPVEIVDDLIPGPALYHATLTIENDPVDTYINMEGWPMGIVIVNGFVLGRYTMLGPQKALYLPAPFLKSGSNDIVIFEHFTPQLQVQFSADPIYSN